MSFGDFEADITKPMEAAVRRQFHLRPKSKPGESAADFQIDRPLIPKVAPAELPPEERFAVDTFHGFMEIRGTLERLHDIELYVRRFPYRGSRVTRERYLRFHIEAYFHEAYILRERLSAFGKRSTRAYKRGARRERSVRVAQQLETIVASLDDVVEVRSRHVHESRFEEMRLLNLATLELIERNSRDPIWSQLLKGHYPLVRRYWAGWVREMNSSIEELLNMYFVSLHPLMFEEHVLVLPSAAA